MGFADKLRQRRLALGLTQDELGKMIGVSGNSVGNYENGVSSPNAPTLYRLFSALNCDANYLYQDELPLPETEKASNSAEAESEAEVKKRAKLLAEAFTRGGWINPGEDISDDQLRFLRGVVLMLDEYFG